MVSGDEMKVSHRHTDGSSSGRYLVSLEGLRVGRFHRVSGTKCEFESVDFSVIVTSLTRIDHTF